MEVDGAERRCGERGEHAGVGGDGFGDALAATQPSADELVGVRPVDLGAGRALERAAGLARDRQNAAGFVDGGVTVEQFAGGPVDVVDAAPQQNRLQAASGVPGGACWKGIGGQRWYSSRRALAGGDERRQTCRQADELDGFGDRGAMPQWPGSGRLPLRGLGVWRWHRDRAPGDFTNPALHGHPPPGRATATIPVL